MIDFDVELDRQQFDQIIHTLKEVDPNNLSAHIASAINRTAQHARKIGDDKIRKVYTIKKRDVMKRVSIERASKSNLQAVIRVRGPEERVNVYKASLRKRSGVFVSIKKGGGALVPRSFDKQMQKNFYAREGAARLPIRPLFGPSVPQLWGNEVVMENLQEETLEMYQKRLRHELERLIWGGH
jgi:hypothetical protein